MFALLLRAAGTGEALIGTNLLATAHALRLLWPSRYPEPVLDGRNNRLLNANDFPI